MRSGYDQEKRRRPTSLRLTRHSPQTAVQFAANFISLMTHHEGPAVARRDGVTLIRAEFHRRYRKASLKGIVSSISMTR